MALLLERNPALEVEFAGLRSDTYTLGRCGWRVAIEDVDYHRDTRRIVLYHPDTGLTFIGHVCLPRHLEHDFAVTSRASRLPPVALQQCAIRGQGRTVIMQGGWPSLRYVETIPRLETVEYRDLFDLPLFASLNEPAAEQLIVEPATVSELLDQIRRMQAPEQAAIRERERQRERLAPKTRLHAQILSIAA